ncbi:MAG: cytochrome c-type biogenesis protein CcmH [Magnetococcales bacterium]|nr:cytochrome c-type biogenesis protein CcmH [Magnetococcales bacterium]
MKRSLMSILLLAAWLFVPLLHAATTDEDPTEAKVREIGKTLRCAVCQNQPIYESNSDLAKDMLAIIREKVQAGESPEEIKSYFHQRYGDYIYLEPTQTGSNMILWAAPFVGLLVGGLVLAAALRRWRRAPPSKASPSVESVSSIQAVDPPQPSSDKEALQARIQKEMAQLDQ